MLGSGVPIPDRNPVPGNHFSMYIKRYDNITFNNTNNISKNINQYTTDIVNKHKIKKVSNDVWIVKPSGCHCTDGHLTGRAFTEGQNISHSADPPEEHFPVL